ncbi:reverse transcriptase [Gossypium australe]|uniref:Reverse transcriptase n=1 Tax=Gossypium australe TaxID=47621 RepID=A0A5B6WJW6_9ROSI|nr:reverse transcriptase [Gossypium australe]
MGPYDEESIARQRKLIEIVRNCEEEIIFEDTVKITKYDIQDSKIKGKNWEKMILPSKVDRQLPNGKPTGSNENHLLKCSWFGEPTGSTKASVLTEAT